MADEKHVRFLDIKVTTADDDGVAVVVVVVAVVVVVVNLIVTYFCFCPWPMHQLKGGSQDCFCAVVYLH